jgi:hypothetical protein
MKLDITFLQSIVAPLATPAAPALVLGNQLYQGMIMTNVHPFIAGIGATFSGLGMEATGALGFTMAIQAIVRKDFQRAALAMLGIAGYACFVILGLNTTPNATAFASLVMVTLSADLVSGIYQVGRSGERQQESATDQTVKTLEAETRNINAKARLAKISGNIPAQSESIGNLPHPGGNLPETYRDWRGVPDEHRRKMADMTPAQIQQEYRVSERTARNWKNHTTTAETEHK